MGDTPKTDAAIINFEYEETWLGGERGSDSKEIIEPDFCRSLERKYNTLIAKLEALAKQWEDAPFLRNSRESRATAYVCATQLDQIIQEAKQ